MECLGARNWSPDRVYDEAVRLGAQGALAAAIGALAKVIGADRHHFDAHKAMFIWSRQMPEAVIETLAGVWANAISPGMSIEAAEEFAIDAFGGRWDRYDLFSEMAIFELRRGRPQRAEDVLGICMDACDGDGWKPAEVEEKYDRVAGDYADNPIHAEAAALFCRAATARLAGKAGLRIIDAACGTGGLAPYLRPYASRLIGTDLSPAMAERARPLYDEIVVGDLTRTLPELAGGGDVVVCCGTTYYFADMAPFFAAARAALLPGGLLIFSDHPAPMGRGVMVMSGGTRRFCHSPDLLRELAAAAGLREVGFDVIPCFQLPCRIWCFTRAAG